MSFEANNDATWVVGLLALCGPEFGGAVIDDEVEQDFLAAFERASQSRLPLKTIPSSVPIDTLTGSLDLAATLALGVPSYTKGLLVSDDHSGLLLRRAERLDAACGSACASALDDNALMILAVTHLADEDAMMMPKLSERLTFLVIERAKPVWTDAEIGPAKSLLPDVTIPDAWIQEFVQAAVVLGIASPRFVIQAVKVARGVAALMGKTVVDEQAVAIASRLVLSHRATRLPSPAEDEQPDAPPPEDAPNDAPEDAEDQDRSNPEQSEIIVDAVTAALPLHVLESLMASGGKTGASRNMKASNVRQSGGQRGKRIGQKRATSLARQRLDLLATLRSAAPWQPFRRKMTGVDRMIVMRDDFRVSRIKQRNQSTAIFVVDASGSTAFQRLAEAKGAVEAILSECYVRRDRAALISFRSKSAEVLLPPTRSLERAKRALAGLPGGGGTPLASGLDQAHQMAIQVRRGGGLPTIILLTDGRANVTRDGEGNKAKAVEEMLSAARIFAAEGFDALLIDVSPEPQKQARNLAEAMKARFLQMPRAGAMDIAKPVRMALMAGRT